MSTQVLNGDFTAELARRGHLDYMSYCWERKDPFIIGQHTRKICTEIDDAIKRYEQGQSSFLIIEIPFRHGKSDIVSRYLPSHLLGQFPDCEVLVASYAADFANDLSRAARSKIRSVAFQKLYPKIRLSGESSSVQHWEIEIYNEKTKQFRTGGVANWAGVGGAITGKGYNFGFLDDYLKNREDAESQSIRNTQWDWFTNVFLTRRAPVSLTIILATPWHTDDIIGRIEERINPENEKYDVDFPKFKILKFPARSKELYGDKEFLFLERFSREWYLSQFATLQSYGSAGLLQCSPITRGGNIIKTDKVKLIELSELPVDLRMVRFWDLASTEKELNKSDPDYTAGIKMGVKWIFNPEIKERIPHIYISSLIRFRAEAPERDRHIRQTAEIDGAEVRIGVESVAGYKDTYTHLSEVFKGTRIVEKVSPVKDLMVRVSAIEPSFEAGNVYCVKGEWIYEFLQEATAFPSGAHDDQIAALIGGYEMLKVNFNFSEIGTMESKRENINDMSMKRGSEFNFGEFNEKKI